MLIKIRKILQSLISEMGRSHNLHTLASRFERSYCSLKLPPPVNLMNEKEMGTFILETGRALSLSAIFEFGVSSILLVLHGTSKRDIFRIQAEAMHGRFTRALAERARADESGEQYERGEELEQGLFLAGCLDSNLHDIKAWPPKRDWITLFLSKTLAD